MKKIILSLAVVAASGAYVLVENRTNVEPGIETAAATPPSKSGPAVAPAVLSTGPQAEPSPLRQPAATTVASLSTRRTQPGAPAGSVALPRIDVAEIAPPSAALPAPTPAVPPTTPEPVVPLPRPRPTPPATIRTAQSAALASAQFNDGTFKGASEDAYYGRVQIAATIQSGQIVSLRVLQYPNDRRTSRYINSQALPILTQEVLQAQNGSIDMVSGATLTSEAFIRSLRTALRSAGGGNA